MCEAIVIGSSEREQGQGCQQTGSKHDRQGHGLER